MFLSTNKSLSITYNLLSVSIIFLRTALKANSKLVFLLGLLIFCCIYLGKAQGLNEFGGDLASAKKIQVNNTYKFLLTPVGFGLVQEYKLDKNRSANLFKEERNRPGIV